VDRTRMRIRRKIRLRLGNHRLLFFRAEFWNTMVYDRVAITNQTTDKMYVPFWDFQENTKQEWIEHALLDVQQRFALGDIFVIQTFPRESYRAFGFDKLDFMELVSLLAETEYLDVNYLRGNNLQAYQKLKWRPKIKFEKLVDIMLNEDLERWQRFLNGDSFPWDAPLYPDENKIITRSSTENKNSSYNKPSIKRN